MGGRADSFFFFFFSFLLFSFLAWWAADGRKEGRNGGGLFLRNYVSSQMRLLHRMLWDAHVPVEINK